MQKPKISIDIVSDVVCPWCYIGKRRLENAMNALRDEYEFEVTYHPFELNPGMPATGADQKAYLSNKFGGADRYAEITGHTTRTAAGDGLTFDFSKQSISPNTRKAHSLIGKAMASGHQSDVMESFFKAYFTEGIDLSVDANLVSVATRGGLAEGDALEVLRDENALLKVAMEEQEMQKLGITGVPFYIINKKYGVSGAQASETFVNAFREIGKEAVSAGESCDVDGKNC